MAIDPEIREKLRDVFEAPLKSTLHRRTVEQPWDEAAERVQRPFHYALVPAAVWKGSKFERSFVTSLGNVWERAAVAIGAGVHGWASRAFVYEGEIHSAQLHVIQAILNDLEALRRRPDWDAELGEVLAAANGPTQPAAVTVDVATGSTAADHGTHSYFEVKAPLPNSDQTKVSKEKMLKLAAMEGRECGYFALPYNPYGTRDMYAHPFPKRWFDMINDRVVLIGDDFWDRIGGSGTWESMIEIAMDVGADYETRILDDYLLD